MRLRLRRYEPFLGSPHGYPPLHFVGAAAATGDWRLAFSHPLHYAGSALADGQAHTGGEHRYAGWAAAGAAFALKGHALRFSVEALAGGRVRLGGRHAFVGAVSASGAWRLKAPRLAFAAIADATGTCRLIGPLLLRHAGAAQASGAFDLGDAVARAALESAYAINAETGAVSRYSGFALTAFADVDGATYGVDADGLYVLGGPLRRGDPIAASVTTGLLPLAGNLLSRVEDVRLAMATDGEVIVKARPVEGGQLNEYWYQPVTVSAGVTRERVCEIGKGLQSLYWQFEIHNRAGSAGEIARIDLHPIRLSRRR